MRTLSLLAARAELSPASPRGLSEQWLRLTWRRPTPVFATSDTSDDTPLSSNRLKEKSNDVSAEEGFEDQA